MLVFAVRALQIRIGAIASESVRRLCSARVPDLPDSNDTDCCSSRIQPLPRTVDEFHKVTITPPLTEGRFVRVAVVGDPNVGKSTLVNSILERRVCPVSRKAHTTRQSSCLVRTDGLLQMQLVDTPGAVSVLHARRHKLPAAMQAAPMKTVRLVDRKEANRESTASRGPDVLLLVVDCTDHWRSDFLSDELHQLLVAHRESFPDAKSVLVLNKVDRLKSKRRLLASIESLCGGIVDGNKVPTRRTVEKKRLSLKEKLWQKENALTTTPSNSDSADAESLYEASGDSKPSYAPRLSSWPHFSGVFMVSALTGDGVADLRKFLESCARLGPWRHRREMVSDQKPMDLALDIMRGGLLDVLHKEVPYEVRPRITHWNVNELDALEVEIKVECQHERQVSAVLGSKGSNIRRITAQVRQRLSDLFLCEVALKVGVVNLNAKTTKPTASSSAASKKTDAENSNLKGLIPEGVQLSDML